ncbi:udp-glucose 6-dehydrogenase 3 [Acrodontium crateriforme]|uniref:UDP-glucose 6-dehydrogenase n=1 Tax=Acrodontium crateriforme TaxID=150365 RepID=A0AAQ3M1M1_9PEZI|nr:udp-glucose 6-dehydrogenase 3 [Acrodontium crateriforme]
MARANKVSNICCIGAGYVGGPTCAVIAKNNPDITVTVVDLSEPRIAAWCSPALPIFEPGLYDVVQVARDGTDGRTPNLYFSTNISQAIDEADLIFISVNTPTKTAGRGAGSASDLAYVESAARHIAEVARSDKIIVEKSTVPCGTAGSLRDIFNALAPSVHFDILSNPEFLAEGTAINDLVKPDRILIGSLTDERSVSAAEALADVYAAWVPRERIITINLWSSELAKLAANCMLAQRISSINSLSAICEATGANIEELSYAVGLDTRIGSKMLKASAGFGGSCFKKDVLSLVFIAESLHLPEVANYWKSVVDINEYQKDRFTKRITKSMYNTLARKKIAVLGFAYKKNTGDTRESAAISVIGQLITERANVAIFDPQVKEEQILRDLAAEHPAQIVRDSVTVYADAISACADACAVVILTEWDHFKTDQIPEPRPDVDLGALHAMDERALSNHHSIASSDSGIDVVDGSADSSPTIKPIVQQPASVKTNGQRIDWYKIAATMRRPRLVFDGRNVVDPRRLASLGFKVESIGKRGWQ